MGGTRLALLGPLQVTVEGAPVPLGGSRQRAVLAVLGLRAGTAVRPEQLTSILWDGAPPAAAANTLQVYVSRLRRSLRAAGADPATLVTVGGSYRLDLPAHAVDVVRFEQLVARGRGRLRDGDVEPAAELLHDALSAWRGPALPDLAGLVAGQAEIARLEALRQAALADRIDADTALGRHAVLVPELEGLVRQNPLDERLAAQLMIALSGTGRPADALAVHTQAVRRLADELGLDPGPQLRRSHLRVLRQDLPAADGDAPGGDFVGRRDELAAVLDRLAGTGGRLVCVLGPGGTGKSRLAREVVARAGPNARFVPLAHVEAADDVLPELCRALGAEPDGVGEPWLETAARAVRPVDLLVLDNLEQIAGVDAVLAALRSRQRALKLVVTSRIALGLPDEQLLPLGPLPVPPAGTTQAAAALESPAVRLFRDRARRELPGFAVTAQNAATVARLCRRLEGLPLALELAAARVGTLPPEAMLPRLDAGLQLLSGGSPELPERHRSMAAAIDWSVRLLDPVERSAVAQLAVFTTGWDLAAAENVCDLGASEVAMIDVLDRLRRCSLLVADGSGRMAMLDTIRAHARELLRATPQLERQTRLRHARYCTELAERLGPLAQPWRSGGGAASSVLVRDSADLVAALDFSAGPDHSGDLLGRLVTSLVDHWYATGRVATADRWVRAAQQSPMPARVRVRLLLTLGNLALARADLSAARPVLAEAHAEAVSLSDTALVVRSLAARAVELRYRGEPSAALGLVSVARSAAAALRIGSLVRALASEQGELLDELGRPGEAVRLWEQVLTEAAADDDPIQAAYAQVGLARVAAAAGEPDVAAVHLTEARDAATAAGQPPVLSDVLAACGLTSLLAGSPAEAGAQLAGAIGLALACGQLLALPELVGLLGVARLAGPDPAVGARLLGAATTWAGVRGIRLGGGPARDLIAAAAAELSVRSGSDRRLALERARGGRTRFGSVRGLAALDPALQDDAGPVIDLRSPSSLSR